MVNSALSIEFCGISVGLKYLYPSLYRLYTLAPVVPLHTMVTVAFSDTTESGCILRIGLGRVPVRK